MAKEGEGARFELDGAGLVARRHCGEIIAFRDPCPSCRAPLEAAAPAHAELHCPGCGATWPIAPDAPGSLHVPVMVVDDVAYAFLGEMPVAPNAD